MRFAPADLDHPAVVALLEHHVREAHRNSPPGSVFALDLSGLRAPDIRLWSVWDGETLLGLGAWKALDEGDAELKSMRTAPGYERKGVGKAMLAHLIADARAAGMTRVLLETGTNAAFAPARAMYEAAGFQPAGAFGDYDLTDFNRCYALAI
ncbi:MAG TPA: GNAT family N-acetyltransferase [Sphingomonas sp.]|nr:GNAT family N-acetyltransferase [Sphingomonas sp.]